MSDEPRAGDGTCPACGWRSEREVPFCSMCGRCLDLDKAPTATLEVSLKAPAMTPGGHYALALEIKAGGGVTEVAVHALDSVGHMTWHVVPSLHVVKGGAPCQLHVYAPMPGSANVNLEFTAWRGRGLPADAFDAEVPLSFQATGARAPDIHVHGPHVGGDAVIADSRTMNVTINLDHPPREPVNLVLRRNDARSQRLLAMWLDLATLGRKPRLDGSGSPFLAGKEPQLFGLTPAQAAGPTARYHVSVEGGHSRDPDIVLLPNRRLRVGRSGADVNVSAYHEHAERDKCSQSCGWVSRQWAELDLSGATPCLMTSSDLSALDSRKIGPGTKLAMTEDRILTIWGEWGLDVRVIHMTDDVGAASLVFKARGPLAEPRPHVVVVREAFIGAGRDCAVRVTGAGIRDHHARIASHHSALWLEDLSDGDLTMDGIEVGNRLGLIHPGARVALGSPRRPAATLQFSSA